MYFAYSFFNYQPNPSYLAGYGLVAGGWTTAGTSILVDKIALDGSGQSAGTSLPINTGSVYACSAGNSSIGLYISGGYNNTGTVTNINAGRNAIQVTTYSTQVWATSSMVAAYGWTGASICNSTDGYVFGGLANLINTPPAQGYRYTYSAGSYTSAGATMAGAWISGASGPTTGMCVGGETVYPSSGYTQAYSTQAFLYTYSTNTGAAQSAILPAAMCGANGSGNNTQCLFWSGTGASAPGHTGVLYTWASATKATITGANSNYNSWGHATFSSPTAAWFCYLASSSQSNTTLSSMTLTAHAYQLIYNFAAQTITQGTNLTTARNGPTGMSSNPGSQA